MLTHFIMMTNVKPTKEQKEFIKTHQDDDVRQLALRFSRHDMPFLLTQIAGRQIAKHKLPTWYANDEIIYPPHISLEQTSSEITARYKTSLLPHQSKTMIDLTGGLGVDFYFLSQQFQHAIYVEQNTELCQIAANNFASLSLSAYQIVNGQSEVFLQNSTPVDFIYLDPSRRDKKGRKVYRIEDCSPNVAELKEQLTEKADMVLIKYSPMLDISLALKTLGLVSQVHIVSVENECKELLFVLKKNAPSDCIFKTVNIHKNGHEETFTLRWLEEQISPVSYADTPQKYLYEPNTSLLKSGAFKLLSSKFNLKKLHTNSHLYTSDELVADFPGRVFLVKESFAPNKKNIQQLVSQTPKANLAVRNFPMSVAEIRKKTRLMDGGNIYIFATTMANEQKLWIVCQKVEPANLPSESAD